MIKNKYYRIYFDLMEKRKNCPLSKEEVYCETHHIVPKSMGGSNDMENLVNLTAREHCIAHRLLTKFTEGQDYYKMMWALHRMIHGNTEVLSSKQYESFRIEWSKFVSENHPSKNNPEWARNLSNAVRGHWEDAVERREKTRERLKQTINKLKTQDYDSYMEEQRRRSKIGGLKSKEANAKRLEYNGKTYLGWKDLLDETGVSKHLYKKFYLNGIDPSFRVGKDGPMETKEVLDIVERFCDNTNEVLPIYKEDAKLLLDRMKAVGLLTTNQCKHYLETLK
jgi:hypothetical protein